MKGFVGASVLLLIAAVGLHATTGQVDTRDIKPFSELSLCLPFHVRIEQSTDSGFRVNITGDSTVQNAVQTNWSPTSVSFTDFANPLGVLFLAAANGSSFKSDTPVLITVQIPAKVRLDLVSFLSD